MSNERKITKLDLPLDVATALTSSSMVSLMHKALEHCLDEITLLQNDLEKEKKKNLESIIENSKVKTELLLKNQEVSRLQEENADLRMELSKKEND